MRRLLVYLIAAGVAAAVGILAIRLLVFRERAFRIDRVLAAYREDARYRELTITCPLHETLFPPEIVPLTFRWEDNRAQSDAWVVTIDFQDDEGRMSFPSRESQWTPSERQWEIIKRRSLDKPAKVTVLGVNLRDQQQILSAGTISISTSRDEVGAPIFYREVNLPFADAVRDPSQIRWRFGAVSSKEQPAVVLEKLPVCGNCHSFSADATILGMDVDYANDKGSYAIDRVAEEMVFDQSKIITWSDYQKEDREPTFGLLSQVSPDGKYVVSTVKDESVFVPRPDLAFSQLFFPIKGILVVYCRETGTFHALPGADDKRFVQSNPTWSPDGKYIVFARAKAYRLKNVRERTTALLTPEQCAEFLEGRRTFLFDLYRVPFNDGKGGKAEPLEGASHDGMSNYFAKYSPDGKWIVFCKAKTFMLLQPESQLYIIPASGGKARRLRCNTPRMNSWHSWSPNGKWLVFSSKANSPYTQLFLTHVDAQGQSSPALPLAQFTAPDKAANIPEFVNAGPDAIKRIREQFLDDHSYVRAAREFINHGDYESAARVSWKALEINPTSAGALNNLGIVFLQTGRIEQARAHFVKAIEYEPNRKEGHLNLAALLSRQGKLAEGLVHYREAVRIDPELFQARLPLGANLLELGNVDEATEHLTEAVRLRPFDSRANYLLAVALEKQGKSRQAAVHYRQTLTRQPEHVEALLGLAGIRAMAGNSELRNGEQAVELAETACELTRFQNPLAIDVLAAAYAECGRFEEAIFAARRALQTARAAGNDDLADTIGPRLELYEKHMPFRRSESQ